MTFLLVRHQAPLPQLLCQGQPRACMMFYSCYVCDVALLLCCCCCCCCVWDMFLLQTP